MSEALSRPNNAGYARACSMPFHANPPQTAQVLFNGRVVEHVEGGFDTSIVQQSRRRAESMFNSRQASPALPEDALEASRIALVKDNECALTYLSILYPRFRNASGLPNVFSAKKDLIVYQTMKEWSDRLSDFFLHVSPNAKIAIECFSKLEEIKDDICGGYFDDNLVMNLSKLKQHVEDYLSSDTLELAELDKALKLYSNTLKVSQSFILMNTGNKEPRENLALIDRIVSKHRQRSNILHASLLDSKAAASGPIPIPYENTFDKEVDARAMVREIRQKLTDDRLGILPSLGLDEVDSRGFLRTAFKNIFTGIEKLASTALTAESASEGILANLPDNEDEIFGLIE